MITPKDRFYVGITENRIVYGERQYDKAENITGMVRLATLSYATLELEEEKPIPADLQKPLKDHVNGIRARQGEKFFVNSTHTSYVTLGSAIQQKEQPEQ